MVQKKALKEPSSRLSPEVDTNSPQLRRASDKPSGAGRESELTKIDREIVEALTEFRDTLRDRAPLEEKYTVRQVVVVVPPPQVGPDDVRRTRNELGVSQPVFADFLGTSPSTVRSWEQGQKVPSPMARRFLGLIGADPAYWKSRFASMVEPQGSEHALSAVTEAARRPVGARPRQGAPRRRAGAMASNAAKKKRSHH
jgi:putative transcriptional regulator